MNRARNGGVRKRCRCPRKQWPKCRHPWHFNFKWGKRHYRVSLDREVGTAIHSKADALAEADRLRMAIRNGTFRATVSRAEPSSVLTFAEFAEIWKVRRGIQLVRPRDNAYRIAKMCAYRPPAAVQSFGDTPLQAITTDDIEAFRDARRAAGLSPVTVNHDLKLLRKMINWGIRKGYLERSPFKIGTEAAITLEREIPRDRRFEEDEDEARLLAAAGEHLRGLVIAMLDTACRPGELLSLQWQDVNVARREFVVRAEKAKTRTARLVPISTRLLAVLEMRGQAPDGKDFPSDAYVFGDAIGRRVKSVRTAWNRASTAAGLKGFQLRDLRHEAGSRFDEAGVPISYVSKILGHTNLSTTSRYLNIHRRGLQAAMQKLEEHRPVVAHALHKPTSRTPASVRALRSHVDSKSHDSH
jgi:integrase